VKAKSTAVSRCSSPTPLARGGGKPPWSPACVGPTATMGQDLAALGLVAEVLPPESPSDAINGQAVAAVKP